MDQLVKAKIDQAEAFFYKAKEELCKPQEDVVSYSVCQSSYNSVVNYLESFLLDNNGSMPESSSVQDLLESCRKLDVKFKELHLAPLYHPTQVEDVWMNMDTAQDFLAMAQNTRQIVNGA